MEGSKVMIRFLVSRGLQVKSKKELKHYAQFLFIKFTLSQLHLVIFCLDPLLNFLQA